MIVALALTRRPSASSQDGSHHTTIVSITAGTPIHEPSEMRCHATWPASRGCSGVHPSTTDINESGSTDRDRIAGDVRSRVHPTTHTMRFDLPDNAGVRRGR